jgi:signal transduction histidine kinase
MPKKSSDLIIIDSGQPLENDLDQASIDLLSSFGEFAGRSIISYQLKDLAATRERELRTIDEVTKQINGLIETEQIVEVVVKAIANELHCKACTYFEPRPDIIDPNRNLLTPIASWDGELIGRRVTRRFEISDTSLLGLAFLNKRRTYRYHNARIEPNFAPTEHNSRRPLSILLAHVVAGTEVIGVISADHDAFGWFTEQDERFVRILAEQTGAAIYRARRLEILRYLTAALMGVHTERDVMVAVIQAAVNLGAATHGVLYRIDPYTLEVEDQYEYPTEYRHHRPRIAEKRGFTHQILQERGSRLIKDIARESDVLDDVKSVFRSSVGVSLVSNAQTIGVLWLNSNQPNRFTPFDLSLLETFANYATVAIENAQNFEGLNKQLARRIQEFGEISEIAMRAALVGELTHRVGGMAAIIPINVELAHEALGAIKGFTQQVTDINDYLARIHWAARQVLHQLGELEKQEGESNVNLEELLQSLTEAARNRTLPNFTIRLVLEPDLPTIRCVPSYMRRALRNLIDNAVDSMPHGGIINIEAKHFNQEDMRPSVLIEVADTGDGIPENVREHIYGLFFSTKKRNRNLGFGLWYTKTVIENLSGSIVDMPGPDGKGTVFRVIVPIS